MGCASRSRGEGREGDVVSGSGWCLLCREVRSREVRHCVRSGMAPQARSSDSGRGRREACSLKYRMWVFCACGASTFGRRSYANVSLSRARQTLGSESTPLSSDTVCPSEIVTLTLSSRTCVPEPMEAATSTSMLASTRTWLGAVPTLTQRSRVPSAGANFIIRRCKLRNGRAGAVVGLVGGTCLVSLAAVKTGFWRLWRAGSAAKAEKRLGESGVKDGRREEEGSDGGCGIGLRVAVAER